MEKLDLHSAAEIVLYAVRRGVTELDRRLASEGIPSFRGMERGARALRQALDYLDRRQA